MWNSEQSDPQFCTDELIGLGELGAAKPNRGLDAETHVGHIIFSYLSEIGFSLAVTKQLGRAKETPPLGKLSLDISFFFAFWFKLKSIYMSSLQKNPLQASKSFIEKREWNDRIGQKDKADLKRKAISSLGNIIETKMRNKNAKNDGFISLVKALNRGDGKFFFMHDVLKNGCRNFRERNSVT